MIKRITSTFLAETFGGVLPAVFIIGAQKAGTTILHNMLSTHPQIGRGIRKEANYFSCDQNYYAGLNWYKKNYVPSYSQKITIDSTPEYAYYEFIPKRIYNYDKQSRLIFIIRNPIERAYSAWNMFKNIHGNPKYCNSIIVNYVPQLNQNHQLKVLALLYSKNFPLFIECLEKELQLADFNNLNLGLDFIRRGFYIDQLKRYLKYFPPKNILIISSNELKNNPGKIWNEVLEFIEVKKIRHRGQKMFGNEGKYLSKIDSKSESLLFEIFKGKNEELFDFLYRKSNWDKRTF